MTVGFSRKINLWFFSINWFFSKIRRSRDLIFFNSNLFLTKNLMVHLKFWNSNFLESVGIKFETNHCKRSEIEIEFVSSKFVQQIRFTDTWISDENHFEKVVVFIVTWSHISKNVLWFLFQNYPFLKKEFQKKYFWSNFEKVLLKIVSIQFKFVFDRLRIPTFFVVCILSRPT